MSSIIKITNLTKNFGKFCALKKVDLEIKKGEIFGLLGRNGAGKTTLIKCLLKLIKPTEGRIFFKGNLLTESDIQEKFGYLPENFQLPLNLTAKELIRSLAHAFSLNTERAEDNLKIVGLFEYKNRLIKTYSRGMIQRLGLAITLVKEPELLILDEPTLGLDLLGQRDILKILKELNKEGKTIFFSSHILSQIEKIATRIAIIEKGKIIFTGEVEELLQKCKVKSLEEGFLKAVENEKSNNFSFN